MKLHTTRVPLWPRLLNIILEAISIFMFKSFGYYLTVAIGCPMGLERIVSVSWPILKATTMLNAMGYFSDR